MGRRRKGRMLKRQSRAEGSWLAGGSRSTGTLLEGMQAAVTHCLPLPCLGQWLPAPSRPAAGTSPDCQNKPKPFARRHHQSLQGMSTKKHLSYLQISLPSPQNTSPLRRQSQEHTAGFGSQSQLPCSSIPAQHMLPRCRQLPARGSAPAQQLGSCLSTPRSCLPTCH